MEEGDSARLERWKMMESSELPINLPHHDFRSQHPSPAQNNATIIPRVTSAVLACLASVTSLPLLASAVRGGWLPLSHVTGAGMVKDAVFPITPTRRAALRPCSSQDTIHRACTTQFPPRPYASLHCFLLCDLNPVRRHLCIRALTLANPFLRSHGAETLGQGRGRDGAGQIHSRDGAAVEKAETTCSPPVAYESVRGRPQRAVRSTAAGQVGLSQPASGVSRCAVEIYPQMRAILTRVEVGEHKITPDRAVFINHNEGDVKVMRPDNQWVGWVLEIRAWLDGHAQLLVAWCYGPEELRMGRQAYHGRRELIASTHLDVIHSSTFNGLCDLTRWHCQSSTPPTVRALFPVYYYTEV